NLVSFLKSASSRILRQQFAEQLNQVYWGKAKLWHDSKCIVSCGGAPLEIVKRYIQNQSGGATLPTVYTVGNPAPYVEDLPACGRPLDTAVST
ncbi:transposase, partial [Synechococcus sp. B60.1]|uniref:transposase n=1 Tax=Synechococcus sp. B60.1 TaxID=2964522 RepID=UPI0039C1D67B